MRISGRFQSEALIKLSAFCTLGSAFNGHSDGICLMLYL